MDAAQLLLAALSGGVVAPFLTVFGGGGSVLAGPLLLYVVGVRDPVAHRRRSMSQRGLFSSPLPAPRGA